MRFLRFALSVGCLSFAGLRAADEEKQQPEEIPDFNQIDEYVYVPKSTLSLGSRFFLNGPKATYAGQGSIPSLQDPGSDYLVPNVSHTYIDGMVSPDTRSTLANNGVGQTTTVPIASDGRTNTWTYDNASQLLPNGDMAFHTYSGEVTDTGIHPSTGASSLGLELMMDRDMGKIGKRMKWGITAGLSVADIHSSTYASVPTTMTTITDTYDLFGQVPPPAPYSSPNTISQTVFNTGGTVGSTSPTQQVDQTILLGNIPLSRVTTLSYLDSVNRYFIEGAYYTFRVGPTLIMPVGTHFKLSVSAGPDVIYAGSELNVLESLTFDAAQAPLTQLYQKENTKILPGYYVDVDMRYDLTETAGFYVGGLYQGGGSYSQSISSGSGTSYSSKIDFANEEGVKAGLTVRF
jgi:hypothetical protein